MATFEDWVSTYEEIYEAPSLLATTPCPNCGHRSLNLVFVLPRSGTDRGHAVFWCDHCHTGIMLDRSRVVPGVETIVADSAEAKARIPDFRLIPPSSWGGGEEQIH